MLHQFSLGVVAAVALVAVGGPLHRLLLRLAGRPRLRRTRAGTMPARPPITSERIDEDGAKHTW